MIETRNGLSWNHAHEKKIKTATLVGNNTVVGLVVYLYPFTHQNDTFIIKQNKRQHSKR